MPEQSTTHDSQDGGVLEAIVAWKLRLLRPVFKWLTIIIGGATALSAIYLGGLAMRAGEHMIAMFEALAIGAGVFAMMTGFGKFREGAGLTLASCALAIGGGAILSDPTLVSRFFKTAGVPVVLGGFEIRDILIWRVVAALILGIAALVTVWSRNPRLSAWYIVRAKLTGIPIVLFGAAMYFPEVRAWIDTLPALVRIGGVVVGFFVMLALVSACGHCLIRSLEVGRLRADGSVEPNPSDATPLAA